jgi:hypothetical protein
MDADGVRLQESVLMPHTLHVLLHTLAMEIALYTNTVILVWTTLLAAGVILTTVANPRELIADSHLILAQVIVLPSVRATHATLAMDVDGAKERQVAQEHVWTWTRLNAAQFGFMDVNQSQLYPLQRVDLMAAPSLVACFW